MQSIVYGQFLPEILSSEMLDKFGLRLKKGSTYFPEANPTLRNEFSTAANRYGHSQVQVLDDIHTAAKADFKIFGLKNEASLAAVCFPTTS